MSIGVRVKNMAAGVGVTVLSVLTVSPFATKLLAKEPLPMAQQENGKDSPTVTIKGRIIGQTGLSSSDAAKVAALAGKSIDSVGMADVLFHEDGKSISWAAGVVATDVTVLVFKTGIFAIWFNTNPNTNDYDDKSKSCQFASQAKSAEISPTGVITVVLADGKTIIYGVTKTGANQPVISGPTEAEKK